MRRADPCRGYRPTLVVEVKSTEPGSFEFIPPARGAVRPDATELPTMVYVCRCGETLFTREATRSHWMRGHFDQVSRDPTTIWTIELHRQGDGCGRPYHGPEGGFPYLNVSCTSYPTLLYAVIHRGELLAWYDNIAAACDTILAWYGNIADE